MKDILLQDLIEEASEKARRFHLYHNYQEISYQRNQRRLDNAPDKEIKIPLEWNDDPKHNPFYVLKKKNQIVNSITHKLLNGLYKPNKPFQKEIPKKGGGIRKISIYQIPDAAVSDRFYTNLLAKNRHRFSSLSYAYRNDRNVHFAIQDIAHELKEVPRIYVAEFDFSNFFGSIRHDYIFEQLEENSFLVSDLEKQVIEAFLKDFQVGIPLGTSISLFIANLICWKLDRRFEDEGVRFARYADDTIVWSKDYNQIVKAFDIITSFSKETGIEINYNKSDGISILQREELKSEFLATKRYIEFLGYKISTKSISIKDSSVHKIKNQISYLLYRNLIQPIATIPFKASNKPANNMDKDFVTAIMQIRRYLYGNMTEVTLKRYISGAYKRLSFKGIMSFYPLINDEEQMKELDRWLVSTIMNVLKKRKRIYLKHIPTFDVNQFPFNCTKDSLIIQCRSMVLRDKKGLVELPSFLRIHQALKIGLKNEGIEKVMNPKSIYYF
ncbi:retron-type reverse transcriptase [Roseivirga pacifica]|uniref:Retron-type reverse transcriptase n=1 Tax=Roseivirga pacifica TaxID=1267423 RepID=A0A1I0QX31_9BACT|nr:reverse transcriptase domain-containing protein [Roseivirga pacifica]RKQ42440.1 retron-type reverse transcriptase [Roseivirga pacifica]SEW32095.1 Retron-type reverse transcriptase [Roseivirga pacifica]